MNEGIRVERMPVLALRGMTAFPNTVMHFDVGRDKSIRALDRAMSGDQRIFLVTQLDVNIDDPSFDDLYRVGTVVQVRQLLKSTGDSLRILVHGEYRAIIKAPGKTTPCLMAEIQEIPDREYNIHADKLEALCRVSADLFDEFTLLSQRPLNDVMMKLISTKDPGHIADIMAHSATFGFEEKMQVLEQFHPVRRLELVHRLFTRELNVLRLENHIHELTQQNIDKGQRDYYLREQIKAIRTELGENDDEAEIAEYKDKIAKLVLPKDVEAKLRKEVQRLGKQGFGSAEATVIRSYLDAALALPWNTTTKERLDVAQARKILDHDHFGLEKVKERILEILAVKQLAPNMPGQIICLVGPPGVGKTSIAMSVARALNRKLARLSLGGIHDEAEIRGHRKTYIGAMPGRIITAISQCGSNNPLLLLDEIDKLGRDYKGDPSAALLEVLDAEQNSTFRDNFLEFTYDLSGCMFITTANSLDTIPRPLLDRMEVIELNSYTDEEKLEIVKRHLLSKQMTKHGLKKTQLRIGDDALRDMIQCYTRESGVRNLERQVATLCRKVAMRFVSEPELKKVTVKSKDLTEYLGPERVLPAKLPAEDQIGVVTGLAWTSVGGETLEVECNVVDGSGKLELTGNLGDVMKESVHAAMSYIRSRAKHFGIETDFYKTKDIHVHFPEGAVPKDGPSAGIAICTAMVSALSGATVNREIAMTGEISIRGRVLAIGGLKEKTMAALRSGIKTVIIPKANEKDLSEIDQTVRKALQFILVDHVDKVIAETLTFPEDRQGQEEKKHTPYKVAGDNPTAKAGIRQ